MRITADTNVLVRATTADDARQSAIAAAALRDAELIAVPTVALCELVWVLARGYRIDRNVIADTVRELVDSPTVRIDWPAVEAGLACLRAGGDFADAAIAFEGGRLGGEVFVSFDRAAVAHIGNAGGCEAILLDEER